MSFTKAFTSMAPKITDQEMMACMHFKCLPHRPPSFMWWLEGKYVPGFLPLSNGIFHHGSRKSTTLTIKLGESHNGM